MTLREAEALYRFTTSPASLSPSRPSRAADRPEDYELAAWRMMEQLAAQGVVHAEVYISVGVIYMWRNFDPRAFEPIFAGLERARERGERELGLSLYWIFDAVRHFTVEEAERVFRKAAEMRPTLPLHRRHRPGRRRAPRRLRALPRALRRAAPPACASPTTPAKPPVPRPSGRRSPSAPSASATPFPPSRTL
jgi:hypothetical protein